MVTELLAPAALTALLEDPGVTDVLVNGPDAVWIDGAGGLRRVAVHLGDGAAVRSLAVRLAAQGGRRLDDSSPMVDVHLPGGVRMHAVVPPVAPGGPLISFRIFRRQALALDEMAAQGTVSAAGAAVLRALVEARTNLMVSGATGAGKTTLLSALVSLVSPVERIVVIEEAQEIITSHPHCVRLEARNSNAEGTGSVTLTDLVHESLRMRPDRIILGECRGREVREVLTALNTGHEGSAATIHANSCRDVPARLVALGSLAAMDGRTVAVQAAAALAGVIHLERAQGGPRRVAELAAFELIEGDLVARTALTFRPDGLTEGPGWPALERRLEQA
ncbi:MAG: TadA family conjugal transfer-associated ATPase [Bifidobacteriaceae bacterium]|jgi:pilus assembly protein CpaF|nr:TadA family conjugal transfer-associated ATPase [Bifidobacteriaceae bacterium]